MFKDYSSISAQGNLSHSRPTSQPDYYTYTNMYIGLHQYRLNRKLPGSRPPSCSPPQLHTSNFLLSSQNILAPLNILQLIIFKQQHLQLCLPYNELHFPTKNAALSALTPDWNRSFQPSLRLLVSAFLHI